MGFISTQQLHRTLMLLFIICVIKFPVYADNMETDLNSEIYQVWSVMGCPFPLPPEAPKKEIKKFLEYIISDKNNKNNHIISIFKNRPCFDSNSNYRFVGFAVKEGSALRQIDTPKIYLEKFKFNVSLKCKAKKSYYLFYKDFTISDPPTNTSYLKEESADFTDTRDPVYIKISNEFVTLSKPLTKGSEKYYFHINRVNQDTLVATATSGWNRSADYLIERSISNKKYACLIECPAYEEVVIDRNHLTIINTELSDEKKTIGKTIYECKIEKSKI